MNLLIFLDLLFFHISSYQKRQVFLDFPLNKHFGFAKKKE